MGKGLDQIYILGSQSILAVSRRVDWVESASERCLVQPFRICIPPLLACLPPSKKRPLLTLPHYSKDFRQLAKMRTQTLNECVSKSPGRKNSDAGGASHRAELGPGFGRR